jgi:hypothetical protein
MGLEGERKEGSAKNEVLNVFGLEGIFLIAVEENAFENKLQKSKPLFLQNQPAYTGGGIKSSGVANIFGVLCCC